MSGITADSAREYLAKLNAEEDAAIRELKKALAAALTQADRESVRTRMKQVRDDFAHRKRAAEQSLF